VPPVRGDTSGFLGGGQVGCNYQLAANWVIGIEGDGSAADIHGDVNAPPVAFTIPVPRSLRFKSAERSMPEQIGLLSSPAASGQLRVFDTRSAWGGSNSPVRVWTFEVWGWYQKVKRRRQTNLPT
jgi:hypothetical protein